MPVTKKKHNLTEDPIAPVILKMAGGMLFGFVAMSLFNAVDTFFVGKLGVIELAAMSFTFPVVMIIGSVSMGLGIGLSSVVSGAIGAGEKDRVRRYATDGLVLAVMIVLIVCIAGILTIRPLFTLLGAEGETLDLVWNYMIIWYFGMPFVVIPMAGNNIIRATGDTLTPSVIMIISVIVNIILDPLLIFGIGPFPVLGISGAALATVIARFTTFIFSLSILIFREKVISFHIPKRSEVFHSWREIAFIGIPAALVQIVNPLSLGVITGLLARFGEEAVAGFGSAGRVEMLVMIIPMSLASVMAPFSGQNNGAGKPERIRSAFRLSGTVSVLWGVVIFVLSLFLAESVMRLFNDNPGVIRAGSAYLKIASLSYGFLGIFSIATQSFSALKKPFHSAGITVLKAIIINLPLALLGSFLFRENGVFSATFFTNLLGGVAGFLFLSLSLRKDIRIKEKNSGSANRPELIRA